MKAVDKLVELTRAYTAAGAALYEYDEGVVSGVSEALHVNSPECHVADGLIDVLAREVDMEVSVRGDWREFEYGGVRFFEKWRADDD